MSSLAPAMSIALDLLGGDVWAREKSITGTCPGLDPDTTAVAEGTPLTIPMPAWSIRMLVAGSG